MALTGWQLTKLLFGILFCFVGFGLLGPALIPLDDSTKKPENLQAFTRRQVYPEGTAMEIRPFPEKQTKEQRQNQVRFANQVYVKEFGGPYGSGKEYMQATKSQSSPGYGFRSAPPKQSVSTDKYDEYPAIAHRRGVVYRSVATKACSAEPMDTMVSMILDNCDAECTHDNGCLAYHYDFTTGTCKTFGTCDSLVDSGKNTKLFVKSKA